MNAKTGKKSEALAVFSNFQNIKEQLENILAALDALDGYEIAALHIDAAIHALSELTDPQN